MTTLPSISVIILTWNSALILRQVLAAALAQDYPDFEVILVDNASTDASPAIAEEFAAQGLRLVRNTVNRGFAGGNNDGVRASRGEIVFLVNPDAILEPGALCVVAEAFATRDDLGILGAKLVTMDGRTILHCGGTIGYPAHCSLIGRGDPDDGAHWTEVMEVEFVIGAAMALRRRLWDRLGGFDEAFSPAYYEDTDLCWRCRAAGYKVLYWPRLRLRHHESVSQETKSASFWPMHHGNRLWFMAKNFSIPTLLFRALPAEWRWATSPSSKGLRRLLLRLYWATLKRFIKRRLLRWPGRRERPA